MLNYRVGVTPRKALLWATLVPPIRTLTGFRFLLIVCITVVVLLALVILFPVRKILMFLLPSPVR